MAKVYESGGAWCVRLDDGTGSPREYVIPVDAFDRGLSWAGLELK
jgi:uncharacterized protein (DUF2126 family)